MRCPVSAHRPTLAPAIGGARRSRYRREYGADPSKLDWERDSPGRSVPIYWAWRCATALLFSGGFVMAGVNACVGRANGPRPGSRAAIDAEPQPPTDPLLGRLLPAAGTTPRSSTAELPPGQNRPRARPTVAWSTLRPNVGPALKQHCASLERPRVELAVVFNVGTLVGLLDV